MRGFKKKAVKKVTKNGLRKPQKMKPPMSARRKKLPPGSSKKLKKKSLALKQAQKIVNSQFSEKKKRKPRVRDSIFTGATRVSTKDANTPSRFIMKTPSTARQLDRFDMFQKSGMKVLFNIHGNSYPQTPLSQTPIKRSVRKSARKKKKKVKKKKDTKITLDEIDPHEITEENVIDNNILAQFESTLKDKNENSISLFEESISTISLKNNEDIEEVTFKQDNVNIEDDILSTPKENILSSTEQAIIFEKYSQDDFINPDHDSIHNSDIGKNEMFIKKYDMLNENMRNVRSFKTALNDLPNYMNHDEHNNDGENTLLLVEDIVECFKEKCPFLNK